MAKHEYNDKSIEHTVSKKIANIVIKTKKNYRETRNHEELLQSLLIENEK